MYYAERLRSKSASSVATRNQDENGAV